MYDQPQRIETLVIGAGQAGLSVGYHLSRLDRPFLILDGRDRIGDSWRERWDSLRLFTPARFDGLDGMPFPAPPFHFPTKDEMADYLEAYASRFRLSVQTGVRVERVARRGDRFLVETSGQSWEADNVVVAMANYQKPRTPDFARELDPDIVQLHSAAYRNPGQLAGGPVLLVGAGNSASEIARELAPLHEVWMSGRNTGELPFRVAGWVGRAGMVKLVLRVLFHRVLTVRTPMGRAMRKKVLHKGGPLIRVKMRDLKRQGVKCEPRVRGVEDGKPMLDDGRVLDVANVIWCTGYRPGFDWIDLPVFEGEDPRQESGLVPEQPGLYFVGLHFLHALSSSMIHGVGRDAQRVAAAIAAASGREDLSEGRGSAPSPAPAEREPMPQPRR